MPDLGSDFAGILDLTSGLTQVSGRTALIEAIGRRLTTPKGRLFYNLDYGHDVRQYLSAAVPPAGVIESAIAAECLEDERVEDVEVVVELLGDSLRIDVYLTDDAGPFRLTILVSELTVEILRED